MHKTYQSNINISGSIYCIFGIESLSYKKITFSTSLCRYTDIINYNILAFTHIKVSSFSAEKKNVQPHYHESHAYLKSSYLKIAKN